MSTAKVKALTEEEVKAKAAAESSLISEEEAAALLEKRAHKPGAARPLDLSKLRVATGSLPLLEVVHQSFVGLFGKSLKAMLKREVQLSLQRIETQKCGDYFAGIGLPACLDMVTIRPLPGTAMFSMDPTLVSIMVDSFYGGSGRTAARDPERMLTPAELRFTQMVLKQLFADMKQAWQPVKQLEFEIGKHEHNTTFVDIAKPNDDVIVNRFLVEMAGGAGHIDFAMPQAMFEPLRDAMRTQGAAKPAGGVNWAPLLSEHLKQASLEVRGVLAETRVNLRDLKGLKVGDIIPMETPGPATLLVGNKPVYGAKFGISRGYNALKLTGPIHFSAPRTGIL